MEGMHRWCILLAAVVAAVAVANAEQDAARQSNLRFRRNLMEMGQLVSKENSISLLQAYAKFNGYGCYCGFGGHGTPLDETDRCCQLHDDCFGEAFKGPCKDVKSIYNVNYKYSEQNSKSSSPHPLIFCVAGQNQCQRTICKCDEALAHCFKRSEHNYNDQNRNYDMNDCK